MTFDGKMAFSLQSGLLLTDGENAMDGQKDN